MDKKKKKKKKETSFLANQQREMNQSVIMSVNALYKTISMHI